MRHAGYEVLAQLRQFRLSAHLPHRRKEKTGSQDKKGNDVGQAGPGDASAHQLTDGLRSDAQLQNHPAETLVQVVAHRGSGILIGGRFVYDVAVGAQDASDKNVLVRPPAGEGLRQEGLLAKGTAERGFKRSRRQDHAFQPVLSTPPVRAPVHDDVLPARIEQRAHAIVIRARRAVRLYLPQRPGGPGGISLASHRDFAFARVKAEEQRCLIHGVPAARPGRLAQAVKSQRSIPTPPQTPFDDVKALLQQPETHLATRLDGEVRRGEQRLIPHVFLGESNTRATGVPGLIAENGGQGARGGEERERQRAARPGDHASSGHALKVSALHLHSTARAAAVRTHGLTERQPAACSLSTVDLRLSNGDVAEPSHRATLAGRRCARPGRPARPPHPGDLCRGVLGSGRVLGLRGRRVPVGASVASRDPADAVPHAAERRIARLVSWQARQGQGLAGEDRKGRDSRQPVAVRRGVVDAVRREESGFGDGSGYGGNRGWGDHRADGRQDRVQEVHRALSARSRTRYRRERAVDRVRGAGGAAARPHGRRLLRAAPSLQVRLVRRGGGTGDRWRALTGASAPAGAGGVRGLPGDRRDRPRGRSLPSGPEDPPGGRRNGRRGDHRGGDGLARTRRRGFGACEERAGDSGSRWYRGP